MSASEAARDDRPDGDVGDDAAAAAAERPGTMRAKVAPVATGAPTQPPGEVRGPKGPEPTRFGDWEKAGRCYDF